MDDTVLRTEPCPKCLMTFRIGRQKWAKPSPKTVCAVCGLAHYDTSQSSDKANVCIVAVDTAEQAYEAWE